MPILSVHTDSVGQVGQVPKFVYIATNDLASAVVAAGYLDGIVAAGATFSPTDMALVTVKDSPFSKLFNIQFSGGQWSLVAV